MNEIALTESRALRSESAGYVEALDKVKALTLLPDGTHVTIDIVATYYEVAVGAIESVVRRNRDELIENGMHTVSGDALHAFDSVGLTESNAYAESARIEPGGRGGRRALTVFTKRAVLNIGMLLTDSEVARDVRRALLDRYAVTDSEPRQATAAEIDALTAKIRLLDASAEAGVLPRAEVAFRGRNLLADHGLADRPPTIEQERLTAAVRWIRRNYEPGESFSARDLYRGLHGQHWMTAGHIAEALCVELDEADYVVRLPRPANPKPGRPPSPRYEVLPSAVVHDENGWDAR